MWKRRWSSCSRLYSKILIPIRQASVCDEGRGEEADAGKNGRSHIDIEEEVFTEGFTFERTHHYGHFKECACKPNYIFKQARHGFSRVSPPWSKPQEIQLLLLRITYFQGVGGTGAPPFFHGVGGTGAPPFFHGVGGTGAPPFAMITAPLFCAATAVFRPIAPAKTTKARRTTVSLRDIVPPRK